MTARKKHAGGRPPLPPHERRKSLTIRLPQELLAKLQAEAERMEVKISALVEGLLKKYFD
jgi:hypothetical protein